MTPDAPLIQAISYLAERLDLSGWEVTVFAVAALWIWAWLLIAFTGWARDNYIPSRRY